MGFSDHWGVGYSSSPGWPLRAGSLLHVFTRLDTETWTLALQAFTMQGTRVQPLRLAELGRLHSSECYDTQSNNLSVRVCCGERWCWGCDSSSPDQWGWLFRSGCDKTVGRDTGSGLRLKV